LSGQYAGAVPSRPAGLTSPYRGHRFSPDVIAHAVWLYFRFHLSLRDDFWKQVEQHVTHLH
jgi:transposase-like protein